MNMNLDYNRMSELLKSFGLSLKIENGNAVFVDVETNLPMKSYIIDSSERREYTSDASKLLYGRQFYLTSESKYFRLRIYVSNEKCDVPEITKTERKEPHLYERYSLSNFYHASSCEEMTFTRDAREDGTEYMGDEVISNVRFHVNEFSHGERGIKVIKGNNEAQIWFIENETTGEFTPDFKDEDFKTMSLQEATELIEQSKVFKNAIGILWPTLADSYANTKTNSVKSTK